MIWSLVDSSSFVNGGPYHSGSSCESCYTLETVLTVIEYEMRGGIIRFSPFIDSVWHHRHHDTAKHRHPKSTSHLQTTTPIFLTMSTDNTTDGNQGQSFSILPHPAVSHIVSDPLLRDLTMSITENEWSCRSSEDSAFGRVELHCVQHPGSCYSQSWLAWAFGRFLELGWVNGNWFNFFGRVVRSCGRHKHGWIRRNQMLSLRGGWATCSTLRVLSSPVKVPCLILW